VGKKTRVSSTYDKLPKDMRELVDEMLRDANNTYQIIADTVTEKGFKISRSAVGRYALRKNKNTKELEIKLLIAREQAKVAAQVAKDGSTLDYAEGLLNIVATEMTNRLLTASEEEYDELPVKEVLKSVSRLTRDLNNIAKFKYQKDKGTNEIMKDLENTLDKYIDDNPELKSTLMAKMSAELDKVKKGI